MPTVPGASYGLPKAEGLYSPEYESDACGVGFVVNIEGKRSHKHRGACGCDNDSGDGAGVMTGIPHKLYRKIMSGQGVTLPDEGRYATGLMFIEKDERKDIEEEFTKMATQFELKVLGWRVVDVDETFCGEVARTLEPLILQVFVTGTEDKAEFLRQVYLLRKYSTHKIPEKGLRYYICGLSTETVVYKGQLNTSQLWGYFRDLSDPDFETHISLIHSRFSTNTFPSWERAHPQRYLAHNGEINTLRGNVNLMAAREGVMHSPAYGDRLKNLYPVVESGMSDSGCVDNVLEFLCMAGGRELPEAIMTMVPEAWQNDRTMTAEKKAYYRWSAFAMEPWDGPALLTFTDGRYIGAILDRNGLRPSRFYVTKDNHMYMSSEVGVTDCKSPDVIQKGRLAPGRMLLVDTQEKVFMKDELIKSHLANLRPVSQWLQETLSMSELRQHYSLGRNKRHSIDRMHMAHGSCLEEDRRLPMFGWTTEALNMLVLPMIRDKKEALGSMGNDAPLACLSLYNPLVFDYFKQLFAQVTNPPIDPFREKIVMSLACPVGPEANILEPSAEQCRRLWLEQPILSLSDCDMLKYTSYKGWKTKILDSVFLVSSGAVGMLKALNKLCEESEKAAEAGYQLLVLSDRTAGKQYAPISPLLAVGAVHHDLIKKKLRLKVGLIVESDAICPYLVFETIARLRQQHLLDPPLPDEEIFMNFRAACARGISKGAQIFEAVGLNRDVMDLCFTGSASRIGGVGFTHLAEETLRRHWLAYAEIECDSRVVMNPGNLHWRDGGEKHINDPMSVANLQDAGRTGNKDSYAKFTETALDAARHCTLRGQMDFRFSEKPLDLSEVEEAASIAHSTLAIAMNRIGAKSNTGEGGENADRYLNEDPINNKRSKIKQMAQGAKPGEGGELPGHKGKAEHIVISGHDGGTGASSWTGIKGAGLPWELGRDVVIAAMLGADEFGFSTAPLIVMGCTMMRKCHLNTCPARELMSRMGIRRFQDLVGRTDKLKFSPNPHNPKAKLLDFSAILKNALDGRPDTNIVGGSMSQDFQMENRLDYKVIEQARSVIEGKQKQVVINMTITNEDRTFAATLSNLISMKTVETGLPDKSILINLKGSGGQSFCAFLARGVHVTLEGDANDYVGKGLSGGEVVIFPPKDMPPAFRSEDNIIVGNVVLYGATSGKAFFRGQTAERWGNFADKCNPESVALESLELSEDVTFVRSFLQEFVDKTGSTIAQHILDNWATERACFVKVFPHEFRRALDEQTKEGAGSLAEAPVPTPLGDKPSPFGENHDPKKEEKDIETPENEYIEELINPIDDNDPNRKEAAIEEEEEGASSSDEERKVKADVNKETEKEAEPKVEPTIIDIEETIRDATMEQKKLDKLRGFVKYKRATNQYRDPAVRQKDWKEIYNHRAVMEGLRTQAARCMDCGVPFCQSDHGCPLGNIIPKWNDLVFRGNWQEALAQLLQTNNFPEFTGRVCPAPCEGACVLGINSPAVTIKNIENTIIDYAFEQGWIKPEVPKTRTGKKIAVVGSGPSGLAAAAQLNKAGHLVTVYERNDRVGGLLRYGIPTMKLSKQVVDRRVRLMEAEGIRFMTGVEVGKDKLGSNLIQDYDATCLAMGSTWPRDLPIPGRDLEGIHFAMSFLETWQKKQQGNNLEYLTLNAKDKDVIGAKSITSFEILPPPPPTRAASNPWPTFPRVFKMDYGHEEVELKYGRDPRIFNIGSKEFLDDGKGHVCGIKTHLVEWTKDATGRWEMQEVPGSEKVYKADMVLLAMGFLGPEKSILQEMSVKTDPRGNVNTDKNKYATSIPSVYAAGDCRRGQSLVVWAINEGRQAARQIDLDLMGKTSLAGPGGIVFQPE
ncbi:GLT1-like protein [Mya arenaria]|uniref:glutamate synthase (NADH) n=1 Tax=Mya arenaria TaxID=6604 RepID=A0ABY7ECK1_MYAAR|nr:GLT1-like protein [Mya arenaria]